MIKPVDNLNLNRNVWCLLGLPFDAVTMDETLDKIYHAVVTREKLFISTPNLNFLITSQKDDEFRNSVINSDLSVADGKPLIWMARLLNIPLPERVAGSDIIEHLIENRQGHKPIKVFFFGGQERVAEQACQKLNAGDSGLHCVGFHNPGFGSIEEMSTLEILDKINQTGADFVIVSLGAKKGQAWIEENKEKLEAPVISHLGAVVNFIAGNVKRAPKIMQRFGLEWLWRIKEEPSLFKRYFSDGLALISLFFSKTLPFSYLLYRSKRLKMITSNNISTEITNNSTTVTLNGYFDAKLINDLRVVFVDVLRNNTNIYVIINDKSYIDGAFLGMLVLMRKYLLVNKLNLCVKTETCQMNKIFHYNCCNYLRG